MKLRVSFVLSALGFAAAQSEAPSSVMSEPPAAATTDPPIEPPLEVPFTYLPTPELKWNKNISPLEGGNKVMHVKSQGVVIATDRDGGIWGLAPADGEILWNFGAGDVSVESGFSDGGPSVGSKGGEEFMVYAVSSGVKFGADATCTIVGRTFDGAILFQSEQASGQCSGTPKISGDGEHVFFTHSLHPEALRNGCFTVLNTGDGSVFYSFCADLSQPMSEPGCYNNPALGNYEGGESNTNDICVMGLAPYNGEEGVGTSATFAFQKPGNPVLQPQITQLLGEAVMRKVEFQLNAPPLIFNQGFGMLISGSRNRILGWFGVPADQDMQLSRENKFDRNPTQTPESIRGTPLWLSSYSHPVVSGTGAAYYSGARNEIRAWLDTNLNEGSENTESWKYEYTSPLPAFTGVVIAPDDSRVYIQEGQSGRFYALDALTGTVLWGPGIPTGGTAILGDFTVSDDGTTMYMVDQIGLIIAWKLADAPTESPTLSPSASPSASTPPPTASPSTSAPVAMTEEPSASPSADAPEDPAPTTSPTSSAYAGTGFLLSSVLLVAAFFM